LERPSRLIAQALAVRDDSKRAGKRAARLDAGWRHLL